MQLEQWLALGRKHLINVWLSSWDSRIAEKVLSNSIFLDKNPHKLSSSFIQALGIKLIYDIYKLPKLTQTFNIISHLDYYNSFLTDLPVILGLLPV